MRCSPANREVSGADQEKRYTRDACGDRVQLVDEDPDAGVPDPDLPLPDVDCGVDLHRAAPGNSFPVTDCRRASENAVFEQASTRQVLGFSTHEPLVFNLAERECKFFHAPSEAVEMD